jgi:hypothetical protein
MAVMRRFAAMLVTCIPLFAVAWTAPVAASDARSATVTGSATGHVVLLGVGGHCPSGETEAAFIALVTSAHGATTFIADMCIARDCGVAGPFEMTKGHNFIDGDLGGSMQCVAGGEHPSIALTLKVKRVTGHILTPGSSFHLRGHLTSGQVGYDFAGTLSRV